MLFLLVIFYSCREEDNLPSNHIPYKERKTVGYLETEEAILDVFSSNAASPSFFLTLQSNDTFDTLDVDNDTLICSLLGSAKVFLAGSDCAEDYAISIRNNPDRRLDVIVSGELKPRQIGEEVEGHPFVVTSISQDFPPPYAGREVVSHIDGERAILSLIHHDSYSSYVFVNPSSTEWDTLSVDDDSLICNLIAALTTSEEKSCFDEFAVYHTNYPDAPLEVAVSGVLVQPHRGDTLRGHPFIISAIEEFIPLEFVERSTIASVSQEEGLLSVSEENNTYRFSLEIQGHQMFPSLVVDNATIICNLLMEKIVNTQWLDISCGEGYKTYLNQRLDKRFRVMFSGEVKQSRQSEGHFGQPFVITEISKLQSCPVDYNDQAIVYPLEGTSWKLVQFNTGFEEARHPPCEDSRVLIHFLNSPLPPGTGSIGCVSGAKSFSGVTSLRGGEVFGYNIMDGYQICIVAIMIGRSTPPSWLGYSGVFKTHEMMRVEDMLRALFDPRDSVQYSLHNNLLHISSTDVPENQLHALFVADQ